MFENKKKKKKNKLFKWKVSIYKQHVCLILERTVRLSYSKKKLNKISNQTTQNENFRIKIK